MLAQLSAPADELKDIVIHVPQVSLLTGGRDRPYVLGLAKALLSHGVSFDLIGSDELEDQEFRDSPLVSFRNLRGTLRPDAGAVSKIGRVVAYYARLLAYAIASKPRVFHILWNNKFETLDRTVLMLYYRVLGKMVVLTVHNVNAGQRDNSDSILNRSTLRMQYRLCSHLFVHTDRMREQIIREFGVPERSVTVIPFGINNAVPMTNLSEAEAKARLGIGPSERTLLFFGKIAPYKGVDHLVDAFHDVSSRHPYCRLIIAGTPRGGAEEYWRAIEKRIQHTAQSRILRRIEFVPDEETELYFKAADAFVLPYTHVFQSGVLFLGYSFGLPVIATDVGSLADDVVEGKTGFLCRPADTPDLTRAIEKYLASDLCKDSLRWRETIRAFAGERHSWDTVATETVRVYREVRGTQEQPESSTTNSLQNKM